MRTRLKEEKIQGLKVKKVKRFNLLSSYPLIPFSFLSLFLLLSSCAKKEGDELPPIPQNLEPPPIPAEIKKEEPPKYLYAFAGKRDPFSPLVGLAGGGEFSNPFADSEVHPDQTFSGLELRGILRDRSGKVAVIRSQQGENYSLKGGKIYDRRNRIISGVSGIIKENSVVLISKNKIVKELPLSKGSQTTKTSGTATAQTTSAETSGPR